MSNPPVRSPIKDLPLRHPGQSARDFRERYIDDKLAYPWVLAGGFWVLALYEWYAKATNMPRTPWVWASAAFAASLFAAWRLLKVHSKAKALKLGIIGEEAVGQYLEKQLRPCGFQILHDIPAKGFNLDHVAIGPSGVFVIETKTNSKPAKGACSVRYDGENVWVNGNKPDRDPIVQAKAEARWLYELLERSSGRKVFVQAVVVYPGWFVESGPPKATVWVLNDKALPVFISNARQTKLSNEDVHLLSFHLAQYVISQGQK